MYHATPRRLSIEQKKTMRVQGFFFPEGSRSFQGFSQPTASQVFWLLWKPCSNLWGPASEKLIKLLSRLPDSFDLSSLLTCPPALTTVFDSIPGDSTMETSRTHRRLFCQSQSSRRAATDCTGREPQGRTNHQSRALMPWLF